MPRDSPLTPETDRLLDRWLEIWNAPDLLTRTRIEFSPRLTRSLGRCHPVRGLVRLASYLKESENELLEEVLCHELAHLAVRELHGQGARPHGPEWKELMRAAGYEPKTRLSAPPEAPAPRPRRRFLYVHRCPVCQRHRTARRVVRRWRCADCVASGLPGELVVTRHDSRG